MNDLRVLTLWQPWATLWADPDLPKSIETRGKAWPSTIPLPAWVLICAAAREPTDVSIIGDHHVAWHEPDNTPVLIEEGVTIRDLPLGAVIGAAHVTDCLPMSTYDLGRNCIVIHDDGTADTCCRGVPLGYPDDSPDGGLISDITADIPYGIYAPGRHGYTTDRTVLFPESIPWSGMQGWQRATPELIERVTPYLTEGEAP